MDAEVDDAREAGGAVEHPESEGPTDVARMREVAGVAVDPDADDSA